MGSGNSVPVERAGTVESEAHQDVFELRLDHLAVGSTAILILIILVLFYWCHKKRKSRRHGRVTQTTCCHQQSWMTMAPPMPPMMPTLYHPRYMEMMPIPSRYDDPRFTEIYEEPGRTSAPNPGIGAAGVAAGNAGRPNRPPLPEPVPRLQATPTQGKPQKQ